MLNMIAQYGNQTKGARTIVSLQSSATPTLSPWGVNDSRANTQSSLCFALIYKVGQALEIHVNNPSLLVEK